MNLDKLPSYAVDLIDELDKYVPHRCIGASQSPEDAHRYAGKRELVDFLVRLKAKGDQKFPTR